MESTVDSKEETLVVNDVLSNSEGIDNDSNSVEISTTKDTSVDTLVLIDVSS